MLTQKRKKCWNKVQGTSFFWLLGALVSREAVSTFQVVLCWQYGSWEHDNCHQQIRCYPLGQVCVFFDRPKNDLVLQVRSP